MFADARMQQNLTLDFETVQLHQLEKRERQPMVASLRVVWRRFVQSGSPAVRAHEFRKPKEELVLAAKDAARLSVSEGQ